MKTKQQSISKKDIYQEVTEQVVAMLEQGEIIWKQPWNKLGLPKNIAAGNIYRGWNLFYLNFITRFRQYKTPYFITFKQAHDMGGHIAKGAKGYQVVYWAQVKDKNRIIEVTDMLTGDKQLVPMQYRVPKFYTVFNIDQTEGIEFPAVEELFSNDEEKIMACDVVVENMPNPPALQHSGDRACYIPILDKVNMPDYKLFENGQGYYATLFHELAHSTGHKSRLNRKELLDNDGFGGENYSKEELTAEFTAAFLCANTGIAQQTQENSVAYIQNWLNALQNDKTLILKAASQAQAAADYIIGKHMEVAQ